MTHVTIVTPWYNGVELIPDYENAVREADQVILIDNASEPVTAAALVELAERTRALLIRNEQNTGFATANNQGFAAAVGDVVVFLNSDVAAKAGWLARVQRDTTAGVLCGPSIQQQLLWGMWVPYVEGWCVAGRRATWAKLAGNDGLWDAQYPLYWEDNDLCLRAMLAGVGLAQGRWPVTHKGGKSAGALIRHGSAFETGRARFAERVREFWRERTGQGLREQVEW